MKTIHIFILFIVVAVAQLFVPAQMIFNRESIINKGIAYKFKTQPVDPSDPYRGKYINLNYEQNSFVTSDTMWERKDKVYVCLETDSLGFAKVNAVSKTPLNLDKDFFIAEVVWYNKKDQKLNFNLPFNRYYMEETKAYDAEVAVRNNRRDSVTNTTYALVYIKDGEAVLNDVVINDISIKEYVEKDIDKSID
ncbi:GDYXXLXY domain-containing protein [Sabulilitoribacter arenilitoris]|uniref:GDYXXLXY domain-containing protein n=1 Tax=Wocania arenilitoris TaxID=2044858 RepID=A0AAE3ENV8_9FLAO|nr:GDYXXLXY domain-containing protein [Wocania arenilitoris]MCF7568895.1 GDYXXLXY domain-containing protein [Wocania arenilitoris]